MDLCHTSYALGNISAARSSLASAQRALDRGGTPNKSETRALRAVERALTLVEAAMHDLGSEIAAHQIDRAGTGRAEIVSSIPIVLPQAPPSVSCVHPPIDQTMAMKGKTTIEVMRRRSSSR
jgi:hypothetical protein